MDLCYDRAPRAKGPGGLFVHVNQTAQYAMRALMHLAALPDGSTARARDLSRASGIPPAYLSKIMRRLVTGGLLRARKGHGGGFVLARRPDRIRLREVIEAAGGGLERDVCIFGVGRCDAADPCPLHHSWSRMNEAFHSWAEKTTLAELRPGPRRRRVRARRG